MKHTEASAEWSKSFPNAAPAGFLCRDAYADRWLRVHSLPESKRYAELESERLEILRRHNTVACDLLGEGSDCILFLGRFGPEKLWQDERNIPLSAILPIHAMTYECDDDELQFFSAPVIWHKDKFNDLILASADDLTGPVMFANTKLGTAYAPYDGGADLFYPTHLDVGHARLNYRTWFSTRDDGL
ncbi:DUF3885 domain-containing protein [Solimicrobium silvestre]|uniref:DUF3885 domain-containing protein n=1 Tax=Solimicrobium silvestre TaxID=2099400 RepID=A0A2S9GT17_9BURK|nr:hypothetical protein [Solimicrobium silvestre]PRC90860.1 hypothetical protein S2091_4441 [Solimicrobium silvestre]